MKYNLAEIFNSQTDINLHFQGKQSQITLMKNDIPIANGQFNASNETHWITLNSVDLRKKSTNITQNLLNCYKIKLKASIMANANDSILSKNTNTSTLNQKKNYTKINPNNLSKQNFKKPSKKFTYEEKNSHNRSYEEKCHRQFLGELYIDTNTNVNNNSIIGPNSNVNTIVTSYISKKGSNNVNSLNNNLANSLSKEGGNTPFNKKNSSAKAKKTFKNPLIKAGNDSPMISNKKDLKLTINNKPSAVVPEVKSLYYESSSVIANMKQTQRSTLQPTSFVKANSAFKKIGSNYNMNTKLNIPMDQRSETQGCIKNLEDNFNKLLSNEQNDLIGNDVQLDELSNNSSCINDFLLEDDDSSAQFEELKSDFELLYTTEYFNSIPNDILKLEIELIVEKMFELINSYHTEAKLNHDNHMRYKQLFFEYSEKFLQMNKMMLKFRQIKEENQITKQSLGFINGHFAKAKEEMLEINKEEFGLFKTLVNLKNEKIKESSKKLKHEKKMKTMKLFEILLVLKGKQDGIIENRIPKDQLNVLDTIQRNIEIETERIKEKALQKERNKEKERALKSHISSIPIKTITEIPITNQIKNDTKTNTNHPFSNREKGSTKINHGEISNDNKGLHKNNGDVSKRKKHNLK